MSHPAPAPLLSARAVVLTVLAALGVALLATGLLPATAASSSDAPVADGRIWVVDAIDDGDGNRWESVDTGTSLVEIEVGDTVEWRFDRAAMGHDLTSEDSRSTWAEALQEYRVPGDDPVLVTFSEPGTYSYLCSLHGTLMRGTVVVVDPDANHAPQVTTTVEPLSGPAPLDVHATAVATDPDGDPLTYRWDFGDGSPAATTAHAMTRYATPGSYTATLEVSDGRGGTYTDTFPVTVGPASPVTATATPSMGAAPLAVGFTGTSVEGPATYTWDFGDGHTGTGASPSHTYAVVGTYTAVVTATGPEGELGTDEIEVMVADSDLPAVRALATPTAGTGPLAVALSTEVTTTGPVAAFADGSASYPSLGGTATLVRSRGSSYASLDVSGLKATAAHNVHVHEQPCSASNGGAHFRFDEAQPFAEANELWLPFTSSASGDSGLVSASQAMRAGPKAVSIVVHDPDNPAKRIGCADLAPSTAGLTYAWDFGDGTTGSGPDPDHTYAAPGAYTASVTVTGPLGGTTTSSVDVTVAAVPDTTAPQTRIRSAPRGTVAADRAVVRLVSSEPGARFSCRLDAGPWRPCAGAASFRGLAEGPHRVRARATDAAGNTDPTPAEVAWTVDTHGPAVRRTGPTATRDRTPAILATVTDRLSRVRTVTLRIDGRVAPTTYAARTGRLVGTPLTTLSPGVHRVRVVAVDAVGNRSVTTWRLRVVR